MVSLFYYYLRSLVRAVLIHAVLRLWKIIALQQLFNPFTLSSVDWRGAIWALGKHKPTFVLPLL